MDEQLRALLAALARGESSVEETEAKLRHLPFEDLGHTKVDHHRTLRRGFPEVIYGPGKTPAQVTEIAGALAARAQTVLVTRTSEESYEAVRAAHPDARWNATARLIVLSKGSPPTPSGRVAVLSGGTSDLPVAEEAAVTAELVGAEVERVFDVGVAGLHRLLGHHDRWEEADVLVVVAGMEGALPSVVSGLASVPVIAVPTSVGYGASFGGLAALLAMLNGCSPGVSVVNIDNGFGAGYLAGLICRRGKD